MIAGREAADAVIVPEGVPQRAAPPDAWALPLALAVLVFFALQTTVANLPPNKIFVGHDTGFYALHPQQLLRTSAGSWEVKTAFGFPNFQALLTLPYALIVAAINATGISEPAIGRVYYLIELLTASFGSFGLSWLAVRRVFPRARRAVVAVAAAGAAILAAYNILDAVLLLYPASPFQLEMLLWPGVVAAALAVLWYRPTFVAGLGLGLLIAFATMGNPAHTMLGFALLACMFVVDGTTTRRWKLGLAAGAGAMVVGAMTYMWLPAVASLFLYKGGVTTTEAADPASLAASQAILASRTSLENLLRFDGLIWWPRTRNGDLYASGAMVCLAFAPVLVAMIAFATRSRLVRWLWLTALIGLFLAKGTHQPFPIDLLWLQAHVPLLAAFRANYDKFVLIVLIALPPLFAVGIAEMLLARARYAPWAALAALSCVVAAAWPFLAGRIAEPYFLTNVPADYASVDRIMGPDARTLSLPGGPGQIYVASWFKGSNFENFLFRGHVINGALFKERAISAAPLYDDVDGVQAQELPRLLGAIGLYGIDHVLLHKDYLTSYRMAFDYERYKVLGPLTALEMESILDRDTRLHKDFEGPDLVLYSIKPEATLGHAYATKNAILALAYEDAMLPFSDAGITAAPDAPLLLFLGNQSIPPAPAAAAHVNDILRQADRLVAAPVPVEHGGLYREQITLAGDRFARLAPKYLGARAADTFAFAQPHGDWLNGSRPVRDNVTARLQLNRPETFDPLLLVRAQRVPNEVSATWMGSESGVVWPLSSYGAEPVPDDDLAEGMKTPRVDAQYIPPVTTVSVGRTSASYQIELHRAPDIPELAVAGTRLDRPIPLLADPALTLSYEPGDPKVVSAWLRVVLRRSDGHVVYLDKELNASGSLESWSVRDAAQAALDSRFDDVLKLHQTDPVWIASQSFFNPEQAESYELRGLRLIYGKRPGVDMRGSPATYSVTLRSLRIALNGAPWRSYLDRGPSLTFTAPGAQTRTNLPATTVTSKNGALLVNAVVRERTEGLVRPIVGRNVTFRLTDGKQLSGDVLADTPDGYVVQTDASHREVVSHSDVAAIVATAAPVHRKYSVSLPVRRFDERRFPLMHVRYWVGSTGIEPAVELDVRTPDGTTRSIPASPIGQDAAQIPAAWIAKSQFAGLEAPLTLDGSPLSLPADTGWREATFDLREIGAERTGYTDVVPTAVTVTMSMEAGETGTVSAYAFGFGDVVFTGQNPSPSASPKDAALAIDGKLVLPTAVGAMARAQDLEVLHFPRVTLGAGQHAIETRVGAPWSVVSASLASPHGVPARPRLTLHRIDDELYSAHLDAPADAWIAFAETYHSGWRLIPAPAPPNRWAWLASLRWLAPPVSAHVVGNAFGNAWHVDGAGPRDYVIDFAPQDWTRVGEVLSFAWLGAVALFVIVVARRRRA